MTMLRFWCLSAPRTERLLAERNDRENQAEIIKCSREPGHQRGGKRLTALSVFLPREFQGDFLWTWHTDCLISRRALHVLAEHDLTGFEAKPAVTRLKVAGTQPPEFLEFRAVGWGGVAPEESGIKLTEYCESCGHSEYSTFTHPEKLIDQSQWDGSDFFIVWPLPKFIFVSQRARDVITKERLSGAAVEPVENLKRGTVISISPGKLEYWFPPKKVGEIKAKYDGIE
jgi:hypothetical protein